MRRRSGCGSYCPGTPARPCRGPRHFAVLMPDPCAVRWQPVEESPRPVSLVAAPVRAWSCDWQLSSQSPIALRRRLHVLQRPVRCLSFHLMRYNPAKSCNPVSPFRATSATVPCAHERRSLQSPRNQQLKATRVCEIGEGRVLFRHGHCMGNNRPSGRVERSDVKEPGHRGIASQGEDDQ